MAYDPAVISVPPGVLVGGGLIVNVNGDRFTDETLDIAGICHPVLAQPGDHVWVIYDESIEKSCAYIPELQALIELNAAKRAASLAQLAHLIGADEARLTATLDEARAAQKAGVPDGFGRLWGDDRPPSGALCALKVVGAIYHTQGGLQIDGQAQVLRPDGTVLPNLFAGGGAARSVSGPSSWGYLPAMGLCTAVTLGRLAGQAGAKIATR